MSIITAQTAFDMVRDPNFKLAHLETVKTADHFAWSEVFHGRTLAQIKASGLTVFKTAEAFAPKLELIREHLRYDLHQHAVMNPSSWYRPPAVNNAVGGAPSSRHLRGGAYDFSVPGFDGTAGNRIVQASILKVKKRIGVCLEITGGDWTHADDRIAAFAFWGKDKGYRMMTPKEELDFIQKYGR